jgi:hypothetical protein
MLLDGFMKIVIRFDGALLTFIVCTSNGRASKSESAGK